MRSRDGPTQMEIQAEIAQINLDKRGITGKDIDEESNDDFRRVQHLRSQSLNISAKTFTDPLSAYDRFSLVARRSRNVRLDLRVNSYLSNLEKFMESRVGSQVKLSIPRDFHTDLEDPRTKVMEDLLSDGFGSRDWVSQTLSHSEVSAAVREMAVLHATGLAYRMSLKDSFEDKYPWLMEDLFTSNIVKELLAKNLDSYLHYLTFLPGVSKTVEELRKVKHQIFDLIVSLRRPTDTLGTRFRTVCHGDLWMGNLMFKGEGENTEAVMLDFHSAAYLSPASDLAHLLLTSTNREYCTANLWDWDHIVQEYYTHFNQTLQKFNLILKHLGMTYANFQQEVRRALAGQFLCVALVIPIVAICGPQDQSEEFPTNSKKSIRRRSSSTDRTNTVRHLIQMMSIKERLDSSSEEESEDVIPSEWESLDSDSSLRNSLQSLLCTAQDLKLMDWILPIGKTSLTRTSSLDNTKMTTGRHRPSYVRGESAPMQRPAKHDILPRKRINTV